MHFLENSLEAKHKRVAGWCFRATTLEFLINVALRLLIFGIFSRGYDLIREGYAYCLWEIILREFFHGVKEDK